MPKTEKPKRKKKAKIIIIVSLVLLLLAAGAVFALALSVYNANFGQRFETSPEYAQALADFDGLSRQRYTFPSNKGQTLVGYKYYTGDSAKGLVVLAHGFGGGGHSSYMDVAEYFAKNGYFVFAYDATGNDESEGEAVGGMPQGIIDLDYALRFVKENPDFARLPLVLFGHSWGAYSAGSVLQLHPDIKAVAMGAGFNRSLDMIEEEGRRQAGAGLDMVLPFLSMIENVKFGAYAGYNCVDGFEASSAAVMILHSADDDMVSFEKQFVMFEGLYKTNPRFTFIRYENRGHNGLFMREDALDPELMDKILSFYNANL